MVPRQLTQPPPPAVPPTESASEAPLNRPQSIYKTLLRPLVALGAKLLLVETP